MTDSYASRWDPNAEDSEFQQHHAQAFVPSGAATVNVRFAPSGWTWQRPPDGMKPRERRREHVTMAFQPHHLAAGRAVTQDINALSVRLEVELDHLKVTYAGGRRNKPPWLFVVHVQPASFASEVVDALQLQASQT